MRSFAHLPLVTFPVLMIEAPRMGDIAGPLDPRRQPAGTLSRTRRAPPPVEDDTGETLWVLTWVLLFVLTVWWT